MNYDLVFPEGWEPVTSVREAVDSGGVTWQVKYELPGHVLIRSRAHEDDDWTRHGSGVITSVVPDLARRLREDGEFTLLKRLGLRVRNSFSHLMAGVRPEAHCIGWSEWEEDSFGQRRYECYIEPDGRGNAVSWTRMEVEYEADNYGYYMPQDVVDAGFHAPEFDESPQFDVVDELMKTPDELCPGRGDDYAKWTSQRQREVAAAIWPSDT